jgi:integrase
MASTRLTDLSIRTLLKQERAEELEVPDGTVQGLFLRLSPAGGATWTQILRVVGEGGVNEHGKPLLGKRHRLSVMVAGASDYPAVSIEAARSVANGNRVLAKKGVNLKDGLRAAATAGTLTVREFSALYMREYVQSRELDCADLYQGAFDVHINPQIGDVLCELLSREDVRKVMNAARIKRPHPEGRPGAQIGGIEAARTAVRVLRGMMSWGIEEEKLKRRENPCRKMVKNLPKAKKGEVRLTLSEARIVFRAAGDCGYPFGTHAQAMLLSACRKVEWTQVKQSDVDLKEALMVISADDYKSDHVHVVPLVKQLVAMLSAIPKRMTGPYLFSSSGGDIPIRGVSKFFNTRLRNQIIANTGAPLEKKLTSHVLRRTAATLLGEILGHDGEKLIKRILGHKDQSVTALYNLYGYVREMRRALEILAYLLTCEEETSIEEYRLRHLAAVDEQKQLGVLAA